MIALFQSNELFWYFEPSTQANQLLTVEATMISHLDLGEILPAEDSAPQDVKVALEVRPFHTDSLTYSQRERGVYHHRRDCVYGRRIKQYGFAGPGTDERDLCSRCADLDSGVDDFFPGDEGCDRPPEVPVALCVSKDATAVLRG